MKYSTNLVKKEREQIFSFFLNNTRLKFNEIEKALKIRSNMVAYHLNKMQKEGLIEKINEHYSLTKNAEKYIPFFNKELGPLPVVLVALTNNNKILLLKRNKRPYKDYWGLIGGKMLLEETFEEASKRLINQKASTNGNYESINTILHERVKGDEIIKHSFILFFTHMSANHPDFKETKHGKLKWFNFEKLEKKKIIPSDSWLIQNKLNSKLDISNANMRENKGKLSSFKITHQNVYKSKN